MSVKVTEIVGIDPEVSNPVMLVNLYKYWWQLFGSKGFRAQDQALPKIESDGTNMVFVAGDKLQLYRGYIGDVEATRATLGERNPIPEEQMRTYVAKRNVVTGKMRLVEVQSCELSHVSHDEAPVAATSPGEKMDSRTIRRMRARFHSKASLSNANRQNNRQFDLEVMEQKLRMVAAESAVKQEETAKVPTVETPSKGGEPALAVEKALLAKANPNARLLSELYRVEDLIGGNVMRKLKKDVKQLLKMPPEELSMANVYVENRVKAIMQSPDVNSDSSTTDVIICLYMDVLARLIQRNKIIPRQNFSPFTAELNEPIRQQFTEQSGNRRLFTTQMRQKALSFYLALFFLLEKGSTVVADVVHRSLQVSRQELMMFASAIGARYDPRMDCFTLGKIKKEQDPAAAEFSTELPGKRRYGR